jgi:hypothetical protein
MLSQILNLNDNEKMYKLPAGYNRFFSTNNQYLGDLMQGNLELVSDDWWDDLMSEKETYDIVEKISEPLQYNDRGGDVGPLGFEEGESLYDNRLLNRG